MREILFRGKRIDNGEWIEGYFVYCKSEYDYEKTAEIIPREADRIYRGEYDLYDVREVDPDTVGQYTGLTDKNGTRIFEGDIVKFGNIIGIINYNEGCYCVKTNKPDWRGRSNPAIDIVMNEYTNEVEIIGNIHDNPELIGERKDIG